LVVRKWIIAGSASTYYISVLLKNGLAMAAKNRLFISFAMEDIRARDLFVGQARHERTPFDFADFSVKRPWDSEWKTQCRSRIKGCDGMIVLISKSTAQALGQLWEIKCAKEEGIPVRGIYISSTDRPINLPSELSGVYVMNWTWDNISNFLNSL